MSHPETVPHLSVGRPAFYEGGHIAIVEEFIEPSDARIFASIRNRNQALDYEGWLVLLRREDRSGRWFVFDSRSVEKL
jgi:hypothetical protein